MMLMPPMATVDLPWVRLYQGEQFRAENLPEILRNYELTPRQADPIRGWEH